LLALLLAVSGASAQDDAAATAGSAPAPARDGRWAAGGDLGWAFAIDDADGGFLIDGFFEFRQHPNLSWRGMLLATSGKVEDDGGRDRDVDLRVLNGDVVYQWPGRRVNPFVAAGIGAYRYHWQGGSNYLKFGVNVAGGVNIPVADRLDVKIEGSLHGTNASDFDSLFLVSVGLRYRF
jgi:hypothetical protein